MQPALEGGAGVGGDGSVRLVRGGISGLGDLGGGKGKGATGTVNGEGFWKKKAEDVPVDQVCFCLLLGYSSRNPCCLN